MTHRNYATVCTQANANVTILLRAAQLRYCQALGVQWVDAQIIGENVRLAARVLTGAYRKRPRGWKSTISSYIFDARHSTLWRKVRGRKVIRNGERMADISGQRCKRDTDGVRQGFFLRLWQLRYEQRGVCMNQKKELISYLTSCIFYFARMDGDCLMVLSMWSFSLLSLSSFNVTSTKCS